MCWLDECRYAAIRRLLSSNTRYNILVFESVLWTRNCWWWVDGKRHKHLFSTLFTHISHFFVPCLSFFFIRGYWKQFNPHLLYYDVTHYYSFAVSFMSPFCLELYFVFDQVDLKDLTKRWRERFQMNVRLTQCFNSRSFKPILKFFFMFNQQFFLYLEHFFAFLMKLCKLKSYRKQTHASSSRALIIPFDTFFYDRI